MKKLLFACAASLLLFACGNREVAEIKTEKVSGSTLKSTFKVWGNCETCKETIEGSLKMEGISEANWSPESKMISVSYDTTKINLDQVEKSIAAAGYDNVKYKGDDNAYANLPQCCKYERK